MNTQVNKVELIGFAGMDAELKEVKNGMRVARFSLATREDYKNKLGEPVSTTTWHRVVLWNSNADLAIESVKKGARVSVVGKINQKAYQTPSGEKRYMVEILAQNLTVMV